MNIYVGWDSREPIAYDVCKYSIKKHCSLANVIPLKLTDLRYNLIYNRPDDPLSSTEFTFSRFLVPYLNDYKGWAIFCDCDFLWLDDIKTLLDYNRKYPDRVVFGKTKANIDEFNDHSKAKVVCNGKGRLLYSSRSGIPINNQGKFVSAERAIWLYAFNKIALDSYNENHRKTYLDKLEDNEIIRFLELGIPVYCIDMIGDSWAVDELKDLEIVEKIINKIDHTR